MVLLVDLEVLCQVSYSGRQKSDLNLRRPCILGVQFKLVYNCLLI